MNPITIEWIDKAEGDYNTAQRELRARKSPNYDAVCFHAQQTAEKYLKAVLQEHEVHVPKTHQLLDLLGLCRKFTVFMKLYIPIWLIWKDMQSGSDTLVNQQIEMKR